MPIIFIKLLQNPINFQLLILLVLKASIQRLYQISTKVLCLPTAVRVDLGYSLPLVLLSLFNHILLPNPPIPPLLELLLRSPLPNAPNLNHSRRLRQSRTTTTTIPLKTATLTGSRFLPDSRLNDDFKVPSKLQKLLNERENFAKPQKKLRKRLPSLPRSTH